MEKGKKYRDGLFRDYFSEPHRLLSLVNALLNTDIKETRSIEINTLEGVFFSNLKNDLSCTVENKLIFITEAQSTPNPNMPARMLFYSAELIKNYLAKENKKLYGEKLVKIAAPQFFVITLGKKDEPLYGTQSLKDAFLEKTSLDLITTTININSRKAVKFLKRCKFLRYYKVFLDLVKYYEKKGLSRDDAIRAAIIYAIKHNVMSDYLKIKGAEVFNMVGFEWDEDEAREYWKREAREDGLEEGKKAGILGNLKSIMKTMNLSLDKAMDALEIPSAERKKYAEALL